MRALVRNHCRQRYTRLSTGAIDGLLALAAPTVRAFLPQIVYGGASAITGKINSTLQFVDSVIGFLNPSVPPPDPEPAVHEAINW